MFKDILNMFFLRECAGHDWQHISAGPGAALCQSQPIPAGSGTAVTRPMPAKPVAYGISVQACLRESSIWGGGRYRRCGRENRMHERGHCLGHGWRHTCGRRHSMTKEMQPTGDPHQACRWLLEWPGHREGLQTMPEQREMKQQQGVEE